MAPIGCNMCTCSVCHSVRYIIDNIFKILKTYTWILDAYIVDFFAEDLWSKLPSSWTRLLEKISPEELGLWILHESNGNQVWPLSLLALRQLVKSLEIDRNPHNKPIFICRSTEWNYRSVDNDSKEFNETIVRNDEINKYDKIFWKHIKVKKRYEIEKFSEICARCASLAQCDCIVDTGAGMGHLARQLTYKYNIPVICIEQDKCLTDLATKYDNDFLKAFRKHQPHFSSNSIHQSYHLCAKIENDKYSRKELMKRLDDILSQKFRLESINNRFGLIGLHPCGDLAATLLKIYIEQEDIKFINVVGCCYMKLTVNNDCNKPALGYPLCQYIIKKSDHSLKYAELEVACHAVENYCDKIKCGQYDDLKVHTYRALLEMLLIKKGGICMKHSRVGNVKVTKQMTFQEYCKLSTSKFSNDKQITDSDIEPLVIKNGLNQWRQVVSFEAIRMMLAPLVETIILLDRFLYLSEHGLKPLLKTEFDPRRSPRNFVLISIR